MPYAEAIFDIDYFRIDPKPFFQLAKELYPSGLVRPNLCHYFIRLLSQKGLLLRMYTQNIDGLERGKNELHHLREFFTLWKKVSNEISVLIRKHLSTK